jgi:prevent-host-death family protein
MAMQLNIGEAKSRLSEMVAASVRGEDVVLSKAGVPVARIVALDDAKALEKAERGAKWDAWIGSGKGKLSEAAGDLFLEPAFTDEELDEFDSKLS